MAPLQLTLEPILVKFKVGSCGQLAPLAVDAFHCGP